MPDRKVYPLRIDRRLYDALERWAADDLRSVNQRLLVGGVDPAVYRAGLRALLGSAPVERLAQSSATRSR